MHALPPPASGFLEALERTGCEIAWHQVQSNSIRHDRAVLGGWSRLGHWFVAHSLAVGHDAMLESRGFRPHTRRRRHADGTVNIHRVRVLPGAGNVGTFREVLFRLSGLPMPTPDDAR